MSQTNLFLLEAETKKSVLTDIYWSILYSKPKATHHERMCFNNN